MHRSILLIFLMRFLQTSVDAALPNYRLNCNGQILRGTIQTETVLTGETTLFAFPGDLCTSPEKLNDQSRYWVCEDCLTRCEETVLQAPKSLFIIANVSAPSPKLSWLHVQNPGPIKGVNEMQCNLLVDQPGPSSSMEETSTDALRSFSKTSVLFVSISFIILMVISLAWLVFYYVQRFRYAHAKDRLQRRLFNAARKALTKIPTRSVRQGDDELQTDCAVCLDPYQLHDIVRILPCKHLYHKSCIDPWLLEHRTCPMCKADILKYFGYNYFETHLERPDDMTGRVELGERERDRSILPNEIEGPSDSSESNGFSFDHSENVENFAFTPTVPPQLVLNASNAKSFVMPMSGRVGSSASVVGTSSSGNRDHHPTSYSARSHRSASHDTPTPQRVIRTSIGASSSSSGSQGQVVNLVQVKSRASSASVTRAATIRKESIPQPTPIDISSERPATTSTNTQVV